MFQETYDLIGKASKADHMFYYERDFSTNTVTQKYKWSRQGIAHQITPLRHMTEDNLKEIFEAAKNKRVIDCLLQIHIAVEESKFGLDEVELTKILTSDDFKNLKNIRIVGLMGMASFTDNQNQIEKEFNYLKTLFDKLKITNSELQTLSMGMSNDYLLAISCGSTMIRIGSSIFGGR